MTTLQEIVNNQLQIPYEDITTSQLASDTQLCQQIQQILAENNFYHFKIDGLYGKITRESLRDFKEAFSLSGGDILGPTTAQFLLRIDQPNLIKDIPIPTNKEETVQAIIKECKRQGLILNSQIAYVLATVEHETANLFQPLEEAFFLKPRSAQIAHLQTKPHFPYYGRGYIMLTHKFNYQRYSDILGIDLVSNPQRALEPIIALFILVDGLAMGRFTGKKLGDFINANKTDFVNARRLVNGLDRSQHLANLANNWLNQLNSLPEQVHAAEDEP